MLIHNTTIDGVTYTTKTLPASAGLVILPKLLSLFGEPVLKLFFVADQAEKEALLKDPQVVASILHNISKNAAEDDGLLVVKDLLVNTSADKVKVGDTDIEAAIPSHFDTHFQGRYGHLFQVAMWVASVNFTAL